MQVGVTYYVIDGPEGILTPYAGKSNGLYEKKGSAEAFLRKTINDTRKSVEHSEMVDKNLGRDSATNENTQAWYRRLRMYEEAYKVRPVILSWAD